MNGSHMCEDAIDTEYIGRHMLETDATIKATSFPRRSVVISAGQLQTLFCSFQQRGFPETQCVRLTGPACSPHLSPIENLWSIMERRIEEQSRPVVQLKCCENGEWTQSPVAKL